MALLNAITQTGPVRGAALSENCSVFKAIPFAKPPVGALRFAPPQEPEKWTEERLCDCFAKACIQAPRGGAPLDISEDCLYLNVFTPAKAAGEKLPVMVWIHGGGFMGGASFSPEFDGQQFCAQGIVLVSIAYRCGLMGFFAHPSCEERNGLVGNYGLMDQRMAMRWVQDNIAQFGGDPQNVTIFGQSAGGVSVRMLLTDPEAEGLFHKAIVQSGGGLNEADMVRSKESYVDMCVKAAELAGIDADALMTMDATELDTRLNAAVREVMKGVFEVGYFQPYVDGITITEVPGYLVAQGKYHAVPIICGTVAGDSWMFSRKIRSGIEGRTELFKAFSYSPGLAWAQTQVEQEREPIYTFYFDRKQPEDPHRMLHMRNGPPPYGVWAPHGSDIAYVFGNLTAKSDKYQDYDCRLSAVMNAYWSNFAKTGDPNGEGLPLWQRYEKDCPLTMIFGDETYGMGTLAETAAEQYVIDYTKGHPGMLERFEAPAQD